MKEAKRCVGERTKMLKDEIEKVLEDIAKMHLSKEITDRLSSYNVYTYQAIAILELVEKEKAQQEISCQLPGLNCKYNYLAGTLSGCKYQGYCDYQLPKKEGERWENQKTF